MGQTSSVAPKQCSFGANILMVEMDVVRSSSESERSTFSSQNVCGTHESGSGRRDEALRTLKALTPRTFILVKCFLRISRLGAAS